MFALKKYSHRFTVKKKGREGEREGGRKKERKEGREERTQMSSMNEL